MAYAARKTLEEGQGPEEVRRLALQASLQDTAAFGDLYRMFFPQVHQYVLARVAGREEAEDITNTIFEKALAAMSRYRPTPAQFSTWLYTIAKNAVIDYYRRRRLPVQDGAEDDLRRSPDPAGDPEALLLADERRRRLHEAILELTDEQRQVVGCRFYFNLSIHEVAQATGKTEGAVKALQFRALQRLHRRLAPDWSLG